MSVRQAQYHEAQLYPISAISPDCDRRMRIVVENGVHSLENLGDVAMLQVAVSRIAKLWPHASIEVITDMPELLTAYCPSARPLPARGRRIWFGDKSLFGGYFYRLVPPPASSHVMEFEREIRRRWPSLARAMIKSRMKLRRIDSVELSLYLDALFAADLVIVSGCGGINDAFREFAMTFLDVLAMASRVGIRTVMFGQGFGPIRDSKLLARAKAVLPGIDVICTRESRAGVPLLNSLGVSPDRVMTTGDDAIELAYEARSEKLGNGIGVNLRISDYSEVALNLIKRIRPVVHDAAKNHGATLIPIPIALYDRESDARSIREILAGYDDASDGGQNLNTPLEVIQQAGCCRVVVSGSYHAAVFALAQGIPVVGLAKSAYYVDKFFGLADQFGAGCQILLLDDKQLCEKLSNAIDVAWRSAEQVRAPLLQAAKRQIESGWHAYREVYNLVTAGKRRATQPPKWIVKNNGGEAAHSTTREKLRIERTEASGKKHAYVFANHSVMTRTIDGRIQFWSRHAEELYGWRREEVVGRVSHNLFQTQFPKPLEEIHSELVRNGRWEGKLVHSTRDGGRVVVESRWILDAKREPVAVVEINRRSIADSLYLQIGPGSPGSPIEPNGATARA